MPGEQAALRAFFQAREQRNQQKRKRKAIVDQRRLDIQTCNVLTDLNKRLEPRFKGNICCKKRMCTSKYTPKDILTLRKGLTDRPRNSVDRRMFLSNRYEPRISTALRGSGKYYCDSPTCCQLGMYATNSAPLPLKPLDTIEVCASFYCWAYSVSKDQTRHRLSARTSYTKRTRVVDCPKQWEIEEWLHTLSKYYQLQPDSNLVLLPFANRTSVYEMFIIDEGKEDAVHQSYFLKVWRTSEKTSHIRLRKHLRFTKCDDCVDLRERKHRTMDRALLDRIRQEEYDHYQFIKAERGGYYLRRRLAVMKPEEALSIIIDGADWYNYAIPYWATKTHSTSKLFRAPIYLLGVISHGRGTKCYVVPGHFKQGTNVVLDVLIRTLQTMKERGENIPRKMYLQLDNTCKQNKNRFLLGVLGFLVYIGVCDKILVSFLPKGHTHEDIDQLFSRLVIALMCRDARSVKELCSIIRSAYKDKAGRYTETEEVVAPANLSDWIEPYLNDFSGLTKFRQFIIKWNTDRTDVITRVRKNSTNGAWQGIEEKTDFTKIFKSTPPRVIPTLPACQRRATPQGDDRKGYEKSLEKVMEGIRGMTDEHRQEFKQRIEVLLSDDPIQCDWPSMDLRPLGQLSLDAKRVLPGQLLEDELDAKDIYNVGDFVIVQADMAITPTQRFWVAQIMNVTCAPIKPNINSDVDPQHVEGAQRWLKVWWSESDKEYGKYERGYHCVEGSRIRSMSWESESDMICKIIGGLNRNGTIKAYRKVRRQINYDVKEACGELLGDENLEYKLISDDMTRANAKAYRGRLTKRNLNGQADTGMVVDCIWPEDDDIDRRIYFEVLWEGGEKMCVPFCQLSDILVPK